MNHYTTNIISKIRSSKLLNGTEMEDHFLSQFETYMREGMREQEAYSLVLNNIKEINLKKMGKEIFWIRHKDNILLSCFSFLMIGLLSLFVHINQINEPPSSWPLDVQDVSAKYGNMMHPIEKIMRFHKGIDLRAAIGTEVKAPSSGNVIESDFDEKKGHYIVIQHDSMYKTKYYHLSERIVKKGESVLKGDLIGKVGATGVATGPHLHYEVLKNDKNVDPINYLKV